MRQFYGLITGRPYRYAGSRGGFVVGSAAARAQALSGTERLVSQFMQTHTARRAVR